MAADGVTKPIPTRWIDTNKGDEGNRNIRSRAVVQETKGRSTMGTSMAETFAATPPLEALKVLLSMAASQPGVPRRKRKVLGFYDISRAHFHSEVRRKIYIIPPAEDEAITTGLARLKRAMYGTKDAAQCFDSKASKSMNAIDYKPGVFNPCLYFAEQMESPAIRHGDDFVVLATREQQQTFEKDLGEHLLVKKVGVLGPCPELGDSSEVRCLNRLIRWVPAGVEGSCEENEHLEYEADPRHVELLKSALNFTEATKGLTSPGIKKSTKTDYTPLTDEPRAVYRSCVMRLAYLALDRPDLQFASKELARCMQAPGVWDMQQLKRCVRYLVHRPTESRTVLPHAVRRRAGGVQRQ